MPTIHLEFGGSTASRTIACPGWHALAKRIPRQPASEAANVGTALHALMEKAIMYDDLNDAQRVFTDAVGTVVEGVTIDDDMLTDKLHPALNAANALLAEHDVFELEPEVFVRSPMSTGIGSTMDLWGVSQDGKVMVAADYKFGDGVLVWAENNDQLLHNADCALCDSKLANDTAKVERVVLAIIQPADRKDEVLVQHVVDVDEVKKWGVHYRGQVMKAVEELEALEDNPEHRPAVENLGSGDHCRFCPARPVCPLKRGEIERIQRLDTNFKADLAELLNLATSIEQTLAAARKLAHDQLEAGDNIPGWKIVNKRPARSWADPKSVETLLKKSRKWKAGEGYNSTLMSPAQLEKACKAKGFDFDRFSEFAVSRSSGTTLAPESDPRPAAPTLASLQALAEKL